MLGKIEGRRRRGQQRMRWLDSITDSNELEFELTLGDNEGQGSLVYCSPWGCKELDTTWWLNNNSNLLNGGNNICYCRLVVRIEIIFEEYPAWCLIHYKIWINSRCVWHPTPVLLPGKSHGRRSLVGCSPWGREELGTTERLHFHFSLSCIGEEMATHSSILAWRIPETEEPSGLPSMGSHRVGHDWSDLAAAAAAAYKVYVAFMEISVS